MRLKTGIFLLTIFSLILAASFVDARILRIKKDEVEAYEKADTGSVVIDKLYKNEIYGIVEQKPGGWYKLKLYGNNLGWVHVQDVVLKGAKIAQPEAQKTILNLNTLYSKSYAVIIAIDEYINMEPLNYALRDAAYLKRELRTLGFRNIIEYYNEKATIENITDLFERELMKKVKENDRVFIFIASRSVSKEIAPNIFEGYILPYDADNDKFGETTFSIDVLDVFFAKLAAKHVLVVYDTSISGLSLKKAVSIPQSRPGYMLTVTSAKGRQVITAGKAGHSITFLDSGISLFISTLVEGMNGSAEQGIPDGIVTGSELGAYLKLKVSIKSVRAQTPDFGRVQGGDRGGEFIFTRRRGQLQVTQEIKASRGPDVSPEEEFLQEISPEEAEEQAVIEGDRQQAPLDDEDLEDYEVAGPLPLFPGELVVIPAGDFQMGSKRGHINERPVHIVFVDSYYIGRYEVTNKEYKEFIDATGYPPPVNVEGLDSDYNFWDGRTYPTEIENQPVVNVSWYDAIAYCKWLSQATGENYRLPTEAEWEKAARGTDQRIYPWGNRKPTRMHSNYNREWDGPIRTIFNVGSLAKGKSPYWVYDMSGNVWEWCSNWYKTDYYEKSARSNPKGPKEGVSKSVRGGSWASDDNLIRSAARYGYYPDLRSSRGGFRIVLEPEK